MPFPHRPSRARFAPACLVCILASACGGGDSSAVDFPAAASFGTPSAGSGARQYAALAATVGALEAKVAALEERPAAAAITVAAAAGTYRLLSMSTKTASGPDGLFFGAGNGIGNGTVVLAANGTFTYSNVERMSGFRARVINCTQATDFTSTASSHNHAYTRTNCTMNGFVNSDRPVRESNTGSGTWRVGAGNTIIVSPSDGPPLTVYLAQGGTLGFSVEADDQTDAQTTGSRFTLDVFVKQ